MIGMEGKELHTADLALRLVGPEDKDALREILRDGSVTIPAGFLPVVTKEGFDSFYRGLTDSGTGVAILAGDTCIGYVRVNTGEVDDPAYKDCRLASLGFLIGKPHQGKGYGTQMLIAMTAYLKEQFDYIVVDHFVENEASRRVIEKAGYRWLEDYSMYFKHLNDEKKYLKSYIC